MFDVTFTAAFLAGLVTFFAPCTFVTLPYFLSFLTVETLSIAGDDRVVYSRKVFLSAVLYVLGFLFVFTLLGYSASSFGRYLKINRELFLHIGAVLMLIFGLFIFIGDKIKPLHFLYHEKRIQQSSLSRSFLFPFLIGVTSAFAWTPCIGPILGSILFIASYTTSQSVQGALLLFTYGLGITIPFLIIALLFGYSEGIVKKLSRYTDIVYRISGLLLILLATAILTGYVDTLFAQMYRIFITLGYSPK